MLNKVDFSPYFYSPEALANKVLEEYFKIETPSFPINPFDILEKFGILYQFRDFKKLEGVYIVPEDEDDLAVIGININRPITRQRYSACHELCHHIKDRVTSKETKFTCEGGFFSPVERFAEDFAGYLLMPTNELRRVSNKFVKNGYVTFDDALYIADYFGVSFKGCVCTLAYRLNRIEGETDSRKLSKRIDKYKPNQKRKALGLPNYDCQLLKNIIDSYATFIHRDNGIVWYKFKNEFIYNENKLEGVEVSEEEVAEIVTDLRLNKQTSVYCTDEYTSFIEVAGHAAAFDYIMETEHTISGFKILDLHKQLFQFAPYPDEAGKTRNTNNRVSNAKFEPVPYTEITNEILKLDIKIKTLIEHIEEYSLSAYIDECVKIHHMITIIHPFNDGNGRVSRLLLNWLMRLKKLPPVYLKYKDKKMYYDALELVDTKGKFEQLNSIFYREVLNSMIRLDEFFEI